MEQTGENQMESDVQILYAEKFKALLENLETDRELKNEVFDSISQIEQFAGIIDLFTGKLAQSQIDLLRCSNNTKLDNS